MVEEGRDFLRMVEAVPDAESLPDPAWARGAGLPVPGLSDPVRPWSLLSTIARGRVA